MKSAIYAALITAACLLALIGSVSWDAAILVASIVAVKAVEIETLEQIKNADHSLQASIYGALIGAVAPPPPTWFSMNFEFPGKPDYESPDYSEWSEKREEALEFAWRLEYTKRIYFGVSNGEV